MRAALKDCVAMAMMLVLALGILLLPYGHPALRSIARAARRLG